MTNTDDPQAPLRAAVHLAQSVLAANPDSPVARRRYDDAVERLRLLGRMMSYASVGSPPREPISDDEARRWAAWPTR